MSLRLAPLAALALCACAPRVVYVYAPAPQPGRAPPPAPRATAGDPDFGTLPPDRPAPADPGAVIATARSLLGATSVIVNGRAFRYDCSGFVRGVYSVLDLDLMALSDEYRGLNGVALIFRYVERHGENHFRRLPAPGDLVYFDNTWDKNGNGRLDDPLTHVALVEEVGRDGTISVLHRANRGIVRDRMNLLRPDEHENERGEEINSWLRAKTRREPPGTPHLMSELFAGFGTVRAPARLSARELLFLDVPEAAEGEPGAGDGAVE